MFYCGVPFYINLYHRLLIWVKDWKDEISAKSTKSFCSTRTTGLSISQLAACAFEKITTSRIQMRTWGFVVVANLLTVLSSTEHNYHSLLFSTFRGERAVRTHDFGPLRSSINRYISFEKAFKTRGKVASRSKSLFIEQLLRYCNHWAKHCGCLERLWRVGGGLPSELNDRTWKQWYYEKVSLPLVCGSFVYDKWLPCASLTCRKPVNIRNVAENVLSVTTSRYWFSWWNQ